MVRDFPAWSAVCAEVDALNLDRQQIKDAEGNRESARKDFYSKLSQTCSKAFAPRSDVKGVEAKTFALSEDGQRLLKNVAPPETKETIQSSTEETIQSAQGDSTAEVVADNCRALHADNFGFEL